MTFVHNSASPFVDTAFRSDAVKNKPDVSDKLGTKGQESQDTSSAGSDPPPEKDYSSRRSPKPGEMTTNHNTNVY